MESPANDNTFEGRKIRIYVDNGVAHLDFKRIGTVDVWKRDGLSKGYIYLDKRVQIVLALETSQE